MLMTSCALAFAAFAATADASVTFDVKKGGDAVWKSTPCTVDVYDAAGASAGSGDPSQPLALARGRYDALVGCECDEGVVKKAVAFTMKDDDVHVPVVIEPGFLLVNVLRFDTPVRAEITVYDEKGRELAASKEKAFIALAPGRVRVLAKVDDAKAARPVFGNGSAAVVARGKVEVTIDTTDGELVVLLTDNGKKAGGVAALVEPGQKTRLVELHAGEKGAAPPGTYDLVTQLDSVHDFSEVLTKNVQVFPGKTTTKSVAHRTGSVKPTVLVDGRAPPAEAKIDIELSTPGAPAPFNTVALGDAVRLSPGTFEIAAVRKDTTRDDGTPAKASAKVAVHAGEAKGLTLDLASARLDVTALLGGKPRALDVEIRAPGGDAPVAKKTADADGRASFALSAGRYAVRAVLHAPQGDVVTSHDVSLVLGSRIASRVNLDVGTAVVQVFEGGVAVPAEVRFFDADKLKDGKPEGDALLSVPAGQEAFVPPGAYSLVVVRKGDTHVFSDLKVASGRTVERTVEIK